MTQYDIMVIGGGPAGLTAAIYARRAGKSVGIIEKDAFGGQITHSPKIENYPGFQDISGLELAGLMFDQAMALGADVQVDTVVSVEETEDGVIAHGEYGDYFGKCAVIATGAKHRRLGVPGEAELEGEGVSYCAVCDGAFYKDKDVAVIGGGNSALQEAVMLSEICKSVTVLQNLPYLTGEAALAEKLYAKENVRVITDCRIVSFPGESFSGVLIEKGGESSLIECDGCFVAIGLEPDNAFAENAVRLDKYGYIVSDESCSTDSKRIFTAGDCRTKGIRQIATAIADGATAALSAVRLLR